MRTLENLRSAKGEQTQCQTGSDIGQCCVREFPSRVERAPQSEAGASPMAGLFPSRRLNDGKGASLLFRVAHGQAASRCETPSRVKAASRSGHAHVTKEIGRKIF